MTRERDFLKQCNAYVDKEWPDCTSSEKGKLVLSMIEGAKIAYNNYADELKESMGIKKERER